MTKFRVFYERICQLIGWVAYEGDCLEFSREPHDSLCQCVSFVRGNWGYMRYGELTGCCGKEQQEQNLAYEDHKGCS